MMSNRKENRLYLCDGEGCDTNHSMGTCCYKYTSPDNPCLCKHTTDINHAINKGKDMKFVQSNGIDGMIYIEVEQSNDEE